MSIKDLSRGEYIKFSDRNNKQRYGEVQRVYYSFFNSKYVAIVRVNGIGAIKMDDDFDFISVPRPTSKEVEKTLDDKVSHPPHYTYGDIEVIDYCDQVCKQYSPELAPYVFNAIKYLSRANHKGGREDIGKAKYYVQRLFDKWEG